MRDIRVGRGHGKGLGAQGLGGGLPPLPRIRGVVQTPPPPRSGLTPGGRGPGTPPKGQHFPSFLPFFAFLTGAFRRTLFKKALQTDDMVQ